MTVSLRVVDDEDVVDRTPLLRAEPEYPTTSPIEERSNRRLVEVFQDVAPAIGIEDTPSIYLAVAGYPAVGLMTAFRKTHFLAGHLASCRPVMDIDNLCVPISAQTEHFNNFWQLTGAYVGVPFESQRGKSQQHPAVTAIREISEWLDLTQTRAIELGGVRERTFYHWQRNPSVQPRRAETDRLSRLHALVELLVAEYGSQATRDWFKRGSPSRLERIADPGALDDVESEAFALLRGSLRSTFSEVPLVVRVTGDDPAAFAQSEVKVGEPLSKLVIPESDQRE